MDQLPGIAAWRDEHCRRVRERIEAWLSGANGALYAHGRLLILVPDLLRLLTDLLLDSRLPQDHRPAVLGTVIAVVSPADLLPESLMGPVGYEDDLLIMMLLLYRLLQEQPALVLEHWRGAESLELVVRLALERGEEMVGATSWGRLRRWVG